MLCVFIKGSSSAIKSMSSVKISIIKKELENKKVNSAFSASQRWTEFIEKPHNLKHIGCSITGGILIVKGKLTCIP
jgi:hypothetical protein